MENINMTMASIAVAFLLSVLAAGNVMEGKQPVGYAMVGMVSMAQAVFSFAGNQKIALGLAVIAMAVLLILIGIERRHKRETSRDV